MMIMTLNGIYYYHNKAITTNNCNKQCKHDILDPAVSLGGVTTALTGSIC